MIIPFTYNLLKRHPALMGMIHRMQDVEGPFIGKSWFSLWYDFLTGYRPFPAGRNQPQHYKCD